MTEPAWLRIARSYLGQREIAGRKHNPLILRWWTRIRAPFTDDETPWCAAFVGGVLEEAGIKSSRSAAARSYCRWGIRLGRPVVGCIVVLERGPKHGHVFFLLGRDASGNLVGIGGNQGNRVSIASFDPKRVLAMVWPASVPIPPSEPLPVLASTGRLSTAEA